MDYSSSEESESLERCADADGAERNESNPSEEHTGVDGAPLPAAQDDQGLGAGKGPYLGMEFESDMAARAFYSMYARGLGFGVRVARSRSEKRDGVDVLVMKRFVCLKEGHHKKKFAECGEHKKRKRLSIRDGCPAMMEVVWRASGRWVVTKLVLDHSHVVVGADKVRQIENPQQSLKFQDPEKCLKEVRQKVLKDEDVHWLLDYFRRRQVESPGFFYAIQIDMRNCVSTVVWTDAKARMAYSHFGDAVYFNTTYRQNSCAVPFAAFTGINHHGDPVVFGNALISHKAEASYAWLFQTWLDAMSKREPVSLTTDQGKELVPAVKKVFPQTFHRLCRWQILSRCKKELADVYSHCPTLHGDLKSCVNESYTVEMFEVFWASIINKYGLTDNNWLQRIYNVRHKWVPAYLSNSFFAELSTTRKGESLNRFYRKNFTASVPLQTVVTKYDEAVEMQCMKEEQNDAEYFPANQMMKTDTIIEKQAAAIYTSAAFMFFQLELLESLQYYPVKIQDGSYTKYFVHRIHDDRERHTVCFRATDKKAWCNCCRFAFSGIVCRHILRVFFINGVILLPEHCITKRWTRSAKTGRLPDACHDEFRGDFPDSWIVRYNDLVRDAMKCVEKGAISPENYKVARCKRDNSAACASHCGKGDSRVMIAGGSAVVAHAVAEVGWAPVVLEKAVALVSW